MPVCWVTGEDVGIRLVCIYARMNYTMVTASTLTRRLGRSEVEDSNAEFREM